MIFTANTHTNNYHTRYTVGLSHSTRLIAVFEFAKKMNTPFCLVHNAAHSESKTRSRIKIMKVLFLFDNLPKKPVVEMGCSEIKGHLFLWINQMQEKLQETWWLIIRSSNKINYSSSNRLLNWVVQRSSSVTDSTDSLDVTKLFRLLRVCFTMD